MRIHFRVLRVGGGGRSTVALAPYANKFVSTFVMHVGIFIRYKKITHLNLQPRGSISFRNRWRWRWLRLLR